MKYSEKLNGFWEEGYHYYFEIRDDKLTVREYRRKIELETTISYDPDSIEAGKKTPITLADNVTSYNLAHEPMGLIEELWYEDGKIRLIDGDTYSENKRKYTMKKVDHGPFDHIIIRDDEYRDRLQGEWRRWRETGKFDKKWDELVIEGDTFRWRLCSGRFHVISYNRNYDRDSVYLVPWDLTEDSFSGCTRFQVYPDMLTTHETICDMCTPLSVFAREADLDKIEVPEGAKTGYTSYGPMTTGGMMTGGPLMGFQGLMKAAMWKCSCGAENSGLACMRCGKMKGVIESWKCSCGAENEGKFCRDCGNPKPVPVKEKWKCSCGTENEGKFCAGCGNPKPVAVAESVKESWKCSCGAENGGKFCRECGNPKPVPVKEKWKCTCGEENEGEYCRDCGKSRRAATTWKCSCGEENKGKFCNDCGKPKPVVETWKCSCGTENEGKYCTWCAAVKQADKEDGKAAETDSQEKKATEIENTDSQEKKATENAGSQDRKITAIVVKVINFGSTFDMVSETEIPLTGGVTEISETFRHSYETVIRTCPFTDENAAQFTALLRQYGIADWVGKEAAPPKIITEQGTHREVLLFLHFSDGTEGRITFREVPEETGKEARRAFMELFNSLTNINKSIAEEKQYPTLKQSKEILEEHGPVVALETSSFSMGMMYGSNQTVTQIVEKTEKEGVVRVTVKKQQGNDPELSDTKETESDIFAKVQEISDRENLPGWNYVCRDPKAPVNRDMMVMDYSHHTSLTIIYDDSKITGCPGVRRTIGEVACEMGGAEVEREISGMIDACVQSSGAGAEMFLANNYRNAPQTSPFGMTAFSGMAMGGMMMANVQNTAEQKQAETSSKAGETWKCSCGATGLTTKFCPSCGYPRP